MSDVVMPGKVAWFAADYETAQKTNDPASVRLAPVGFVDWVAMREFWLTGGPQKGILRVWPVWVNSAVAANQVPPQPGNPAVGGFIDIYSSPQLSKAYCFLYVPVAYGMLAQSLLGKSFGQIRMTPSVGPALQHGEAAARPLQYVLISLEPKKMPRSSVHAYVSPAVGPDVGELHPPPPSGRRTA